MSETNKASVQSVVRRPQCRCNGYGFFWGSEVSGWRGKPHDRLICRDCGRPFWFERIWYWFKGYKSNEQVRRILEREAAVLSIENVHLNNNEPEIATWAYQQADAMMEVRQQKKDEVV